MTYLCLAAVKVVKTRRKWLWLCVVDIVWLYYSVT